MLKRSLRRNWLRVLKRTQRCSIHISVPKQLIEPVSAKINESELVNDDKGMASILNNFFGSVFTSERPCTPEPPSTAEFLTDISFPVESIANKIDSLKPTSAFGPDRIGPKVLQEAKDALCVPLAIVYKRSSYECVVPEDWKKANVTPIYKKGSKADPGNYRPVSLTSVVCKLLERIVKKFIVEHVEKNQLIKDRKGHSCQTNLKKEGMVERLAESKTAESGRRR